MDNPQHFGFAFDRPAAVLLAPVGIKPDTAWVSVTSDRLSVHFGRFRLTTLLNNVIDVQLTGPYMWLKAIGVRISLADKGITFGTNAKLGACLRFRAPVESFGRRLGLRHPGMTVTVADPSALQSAIERVL